MLGDSFARGPERLREPQQVAVEPKNGLNVTRVEIDERGDEHGEQSTRPASSKVVRACETQSPELTKTPSTLAGKQTSATAAPCTGTTRPAGATRTGVLA